MEIRRMVRTAALVLLAGSLMVVGCEEAKAPSAQKAADAAKGAVDKAKDMGGKAVDAAKDAGKAAVDAGKDAAKAGADKAKDVAGKAADAAKDAVAKLQGEAKTWITDTVGKQWPGVKDQIAGLEKSVGALGAGDIKTKATDLLGKIKGDVPKMEELVGKISNFKDGDFGSIFTEAKKMWDSFAPRLKELTGMLPAAPGAGK
jgi:hypothetical protein